MEKKYKQGRNLSHLINDSITSDLKISIGSNDLLVHKAIIIPQCSQLVSSSSSELPSQLTFEILSYLVKILYGSLLDDNEVNLIGYKSLLILYQICKSWNLNDDITEYIEDIIMDKFNQKSIILEVLSMSYEYGLDRICNNCLYLYSKYDFNDEELDKSNISNEMKSKIILKSVNQKPNENNDDNIDDVIVPSCIGNISSHLEYLYLSQDYSDFTIIINGEKIHCHRFILYDNSTFFKALLQPHTIESQKGTVEFNENEYPITSNSFRILLQYFYTRRINEEETTTAIMNPRECLEILLVEELFDLKKEQHGMLLEYCQHILDDCIQVKDCLILLTIAYKWNQEELMDKMIQMASDNYKEIEQDPLFKKLDKKLIDNITEKTEESDKNNLKL